MPETCRVSCQNKFVQLVHLVGFIIKKFVTMHGHMNVKVTLFIEAKLNSGCNTFRHLVYRGTYQAEGTESVFKKKRSCVPVKKAEMFSGRSQTTIPYKLYKSFEIKTKQDRQSTYNLTLRGFVQPLLQ